MGYSVWSHISMLTASVSAVGLYFYELLLGGDWFFVSAEVMLARIPDFVETMFWWHNFQQGFNSWFYYCEYIFY